MWSSISLARFGSMENIKYCGTEIRLWMTQTMLKLNEWPLIHIHACTISFRTLSSPKYIEGDAETNVELYFHTF